MAKKWTVDKLLEQVRGFQPACVITAAADLDLFTVLNHAPATAEGLADKIAADARATAVLLDALTALGLLAKKGDAYKVPPDVAELLTAD